MSAYSQIPAPERNPVTYQKHRREVFIQIVLPLAIGIILLIVLCVLVAVFGLSGTGDVSRWADISLIWLIIPTMIVALVFLAITAGLIYAVTWLLAKVPVFARRAQDFSARVRTGVRKGADKAVEPILRLHGLRASWRALRER